SHNTRTPPAQSKHKSGRLPGVRPPRADSVDADAVRLVGAASSRDSARSPKTFAARGRSHNTPNPTGAVEAQVRQAAGGQAASGRLHGR
ncbi:hypothetical protein, partial [Thioalkalivibrio sp.]|uniref:hypothetical protein n=1 Tax=Thioalkalivibrio sp. TaxID=2093813 RepID=UPI00397487A6